MVNISELIVIDIVLLLAVVAEGFAIIQLNRRLKRTIERLATLAKRTAEMTARLGDKIDRVDDNCGESLNALEEKIESYKKLYGDAATEAQREAAKADRAVAEGVQNIMNYAPAIGLRTVRNE